VRQDVEPLLDLGVFSGITANPTLARKLFDDTLTAAAAKAFDEGHRRLVSASACGHAVSASYSHQIRSGCLPKCHWSIRGWTSDAVRVGWYQPSWRRTRV
jgi:hypothetical protein